MRFALIGDSQGQGTFPALTRILKGAGHTVVLTRAEPGKDPRWWTQQPLADQLRAAQPDAVVFQLSGNNGERRAEVYRGYAEALLRAVPSGARVWWLSPAYATRQDIETRHRQTWELEKALLPQLGVSWVDVRPWTQTGHRDGVHFSTTTYAALAERVAQTILVGALSRPPGAPASVMTSKPAQRPWWVWTLVLGIPMLFLRWRRRTL